MEDENEADAQLEAPQKPSRAEEAKAPPEDEEETAKDLDGDLSQMEIGSEVPPLDPASMSLSLIASTPSPLVRNLSSSNS